MSTRTIAWIPATAVLGLAATLAGSAHADPEATETITDARKAAPRPRHARMALELAAVFAIGNRWYWRDGGQPNVVDWQLEQDASAVRLKLTDADGWRFDGNEFDINALGHPGFGMLTHFLARENGYGLGETFLISTLASGTWEVVLELAEYGSLNDMLSTSTAGVPLGEAAHQIIHHLDETRYEVRGGVGTEDGAAFGVVGASAALDRIPTSGAGTVGTGRKVSMAVALASDLEGVRSLTGSATSSLVGYYRNRPGHALYAGLGTAFTYRNDHAREERPWELLAKVAVGPTLDVRLRRGGVTVDVGADLYLDFAMTRAHAFDDWRAAHPLATVRNVMQDKARPYYYAVGGSLDPRINLTYRDLHLGGTIAASAFGSLDGRDRDQEMLTADVHLTDHAARAQAWLGYRHRRAAVVLDGAITRRGGRAGDTHAATDGRTAMLTVGLRR